MVESYVGMASVIHGNTVLIRSGIILNVED